MEKQVILTHPLLGDTSFDEAHAERLMARPNNGGWVRKEEPKKEKVVKKENAADGKGHTSAAPESEVKE